MNGVLGLIFITYYKQMNIEQLKTQSLIPYEFNNKIHSEEQIDRIANSISEFWFTQPIVVDKDNVVIIW